MISSFSISSTRSLALIALSGLLCLEAASESESESVVIKSTGRLMRHANLHTGETLTDAQPHTKPDEETAKTFSHHEDEALIRLRTVKSRMLKGACPHFVWGSSYLGHKKGDAEFGSDWADATKDGPESCAMHCESDPACQQSVYFKHSEKCYLGIGKKNGRPTPQEDVFCYSKYGFDHVWPHEVKGGKCIGFFEGYGYLDERPLVDQCKFSQTNANMGRPRWSPEEGCSHWDGRFKLSEAGCWGRCVANPHCLAAEYDEKKFDCKLGLLPTMRHNAFNLRCGGKLHKCATKCFSKYGMGNEKDWPGKTATNERGLNRREMFALLRGFKFPKGFGFKMAEKEEEHENSTAVEEEKEHEEAKEHGTHHEHHDKDHHKHHEHHNKDHHHKDHHHKHHDKDHDEHEEDEKHHDHEKHHHHR